MPDGVRLHTVRIKHRKGNYAFLFLYAAIYERLFMHALHKQSFMRNQGILGAQNFCLEGFAERLGANPDSQKRIK